MFMFASIPLARGTESVRQRKWPVEENLSDVDGVKATFSLMMVLPKMVWTTFELSMKTIVLFL